LISDERGRQPKLNPAAPYRFLRRAVAIIVGTTAVTLAAILLSAGVETGGAAAGFTVPMLAGAAIEFILFLTERRTAKESDEVRRLWERERADLLATAAVDELTELQNRRAYYERMESELQRAESRKKPLSVLLMDVDDLKAINDEFGHQVGDIVLRRLAKTLAQVSESGYLPARLGGDEFALIMPGADRRQADELTWRLWQEFADAPVYETEHASIYLGVSIGSSGYPWGGTNVEEITHWADTKLYANKLERKGYALGRQGDDGRLTAVVVEVLSTALDIRDKMTHRHTRRVARTAAAVARAMGLPDAEVSKIEHAAALHDIGKIGVADSILRKAGPLDDEEWKEMRRHSELGYQILKSIDFFRGAAEIVYAHHEYYDGTGYPRGLAGEEIPLGARVFAVVDAYDAMTSRRPYRRAMNRDSALIEVARNSGTQFDPRVVEAFLAVIRRSPDGAYEEGEQFGPGDEATADSVGTPRDGQLIPEYLRRS